MRLPLSSATLLIGESLGTRIASPLGAGGLGEDRRRLAGGAEIDAAGGERLQELRAAGELGPFDGDALRGQALLQLAADLQDDEGAVLLHADAHQLVGAKGR